MKSIITHTTTQPTVESLTDYYPFGMAMPGRSYNAYRYGFNSQENVLELGEGHTTAPYWEYNGRLGRRWNVDPKTSFEISCYSTFQLNPIFFTDVMGDTSDISTSKGEYLFSLDDGKTGETNMTVRITMDYN